MEDEFDDFNDTPEEEDINQNNSNEDLNINIEKVQNLKEVLNAGTANFILDDDFYDDIDRCKNSNRLIEGVISTLANISQLGNSHQIMTQNGLFEITKKILSLFSHFLYQDEQFNRQTPQLKKESVELEKVNLGNINALKGLSLIFMNMTKNSEFQEQFIKKNGVSILKHFAQLKEYDVLTNTFLSLGNLILSKSSQVKQRSVELGVLDLLLHTNENSEFLRIKRICNTVLQQTEAQLFEYNDNIHQRGN